MENKVLLLYPRTNRHLGLWNDLLSDDRVVLRCTDRKKYGPFRSFMAKLYLKIYRSLPMLPLHRMLFEYFDLFDISRQVTNILVIDGALNNVELKELEWCKKNNLKLKIDLFLINAINASSPIMNRVRPKINQFAWDHVYTFDKNDAVKYGFLFIGYTYYSKHQLKSCELNSDVYFVGGLKGGREKMIEEIHDYLTQRNVNCQFDLMRFGRDRGGNALKNASYSGRWIPYEEVLQKMNGSKCILEICQEGQSGPTLRYFESVCYNKKLITNNRYVKDFPLYNPNYVQIFNDVADIDVNWLKEEAKIDYGYRDEFSPVHLIDFLLEENCMPEFEIGYTQGTYDMFHEGHLNLLRNAKAKCRHLIVGVNSDALVQRYKNKTPVINEKCRMEIIKELRCVDDVVLCDSLDKVSMWKSLRFNAIFIGDDWKGNDRWRQTEIDLTPLGAKVVYLKHTDGVSSTLLRTKETDKVEDGNR